jgi:hypothetical protein
MGSKSVTWNLSSAWRIYPVVAGKGIINVLCEIENLT